MAISKRELSRQAALIAAHAASWAAECLMPGTTGGVASDKTVQRFIDLMRERLDVIARLHAETQTNEENTE